MGLTVCTVSGCPELTNGGRCNQHRKEADRRRGTATQRGYDNHWRRTRNAYIKAHPLCEDPEGCIQPATDVDHIDGQGPLGPRGHDWDNLRSLCHPHHSQRTARDQPGGFNAR